jgi:hypothetical protein
VHTVAQAPQFALSVCSFTQEAPQGDSPGVVHTRVQAPATHCSLPRHCVPQAPQLFGSVWVSVHPLKHAASPMGQLHLPAVQVSPAGHAVPQVPQSFESVCRFTQALLQLLRPVMHSSVHLPSEQTCPLTQAAPQVPQLSGSAERSVHRLSQRAGVAPAVQAHALETHTCPPVHAVP